MWGEGRGGEGWAAGDGGGDRSVSAGGRATRAAAGAVGGDRRVSAGGWGRLGRRLRRGNATLIRECGL